MLRYIGVSWNPHDAAQVAAARTLFERLAIGGNWEQVLTAVGLRVFCAGKRMGSRTPYTLSDNAGVVLGTLFRNVGDSFACEVPPTFGTSESSAIVQSGAKRLVSNYWGHYIAFVVNAATGEQWLLRDPTGMMLCFRSEFRGTQIFFSDIEDVAKLELLTLSVNWNYVATRLVSIVLETRETGITEVNKVLGGECLHITPAKVTTNAYWNPIEISRAGTDQSSQAAATRLREITMKCVHSWAALHKSVVLRLSGGLDSSIVLACLSDMRNQILVTCVNHYSPGSDSDERVYARASASHAKVHLLELARDPTIYLDSMLTVARTVEPRHSLALDLAQNSTEAEVARGCNATGIFDGNGGDGVFFQNPVLLGAIDYAYEHGIDSSLFQLALGVARSSERSVWGVLRDVMIFGKLNKTWNPFADVGAKRVLIRSEVLDRVRRDGSITHPLFDRSQRAPPGKRQHAWYLSIPLATYDPADYFCGLDEVQPLISQPLYEACLQTPTYRLVAGGRDRALARQAFASRLAPQVVRRGSKGGMEEYVRAILERNLPFIRDVLSAGILIGEGLLDRHRVEESLSEGVTRLTSSPAELLNCVSTEAWARQWATYRRAC